MAKDLFQVPGQDDNRGLYEPDKQRKKGSDLVGDQKERFGTTPNKQLQAAEEGVKNTGREKGNETPGDALRDAERRGAWYAGADDSAGEGFRAKFQAISRRKKVFVGLGAGGVGATIISILIVMPLYRIPSFMGGISDEVGKVSRHVVEKRAERFVINYLIQKAGIDLGDKYVVTGSLTKDLFNTWRSNRLEDKIFRETGFKMVKQANGQIMLTHDGRDVGHVKNYQDFLDLTKKDALNAADLRKITTLGVNPWRRVLVAKHKRFLENKYNLRRGYGTPKYDETKTEAENVQELTRSQIEPQTDNILSVAEDAIGCVSENKCDAFKDDAPDADPGKLNTDNVNHDKQTGASEEIAKELKTAGDEATVEAIKDRAGGFTARLIEKILGLVVSAGTAKLIAFGMPIIGWIDFMSQAVHASSVAQENDLANKIPVILKEKAYGAIYAQWLGFSDQQKNGDMPLPFVKVLNGQLDGAEKGQGYNHVFGSNDNKGTKIDPLVGSNVRHPLSEAMNATFNSWKSPMRYLRLLLDAWYYTIGKLMGYVGDVGANFLSFIFTSLHLDTVVEESLKAIFGENWKIEFGKWAAKTIMSILGITIDPLAVGAQLSNNIYVGGDVAMNSSCKEILGCKALSPKQDSYVVGVVNQEDAAAMSAKPLTERLFSLDLPNSFANQAIRAMPSDLRPQSLVTTTLGQIATLPAKLLASVTGRAWAGAPEDRAALDGVQQFGATDEDLAQDIAPEVREQPAQNITCPKTDENTFNVCMADKAVAESLMCQYTDCPEFQEGGLFQVDPNQHIGILDPLKQLIANEYKNLGLAKGAAR